MNWLKAFRYAIIIDSVVFVLKLSLPIYLLVDGVQMKQRFDKIEKSDTSSLWEFVIILVFVGAIILLIFVFLRLLTNYYQYQNERQGHRKRNYAKVFCWSSCWFTICFVNIALIALLIWFDWTHGKWLRKVAISFLCWEIIILCFMIIFKSSICETTYSNVVENEMDERKEQINSRRT